MGSHVDLGLGQETARMKVPNIYHLHFLRLLSGRSHLILSPNKLFLWSWPASDDHFVKKNHLIKTLKPCQWIDFRNVCTLRLTSLLIYIPMPFSNFYRPLYSNALQELEIWLFCYSAFIMFSSLSRHFIFAGVLLAEYLLFLWAPLCIKLYIRDQVV